MAAVLDRVELDRDFLYRPALELSGGEAQRVCLARTLLLPQEISARCTAISGGNMGLVCHFDP